jgi:preprotein translocase subunit SecE
MAIGIYKQGQGYWTRLMSAIGIGLIVFMGGVWLSDQLSAVRLFGLEPVWVQGFAFVIIAGIFGWLGYYYLGRNPRSVDFLIATEGEMKKVNWSSRREIAGSTWVVIGLTVFIAICCYLFDLGFSALFRAVGVLEVYSPPPARNGSLS